MTKEEVLKSIGLKKRFCKDCNIPINLFDEPYFLQRIDALNPLYYCVCNLAIFLNELKQFETEQDYFEYYNSVKEAVIAALKSNSEYQRFNNDTIPAYHTEVKIENRNLYIDENDGHKFISIDMKKANFSALRYYSPAIFNNKETWEDYLADFTDSEHIKNSKYIRQVILGACNPGRQVKYEKYLMSKICDYLTHSYGSSITFYSLSNDEIILRNDTSPVSEEGIRFAIRKNSEPLSKLVRVESFYLNQWEWGWRKVITSSKLPTIQFKCMSPDIIHQVVKHMYNQPVTEDDLVFRYNGQLARFLQEASNPWKEAW